MRKQTFIALAFALALVGSAQAQAGRAGFGSALTRLFGDNNQFTADIVLQMASANTNAQATLLPGKLSFSAGESRLEINLSEAKAAQMGPEFAQHMKAMGMDKTVTISNPAKKTTYILYPSLSAYVESPLQNADTKPDSAFKTKETELGKETLDGHPCVKYQVVVTDDENKSHESTVWRATDLKKFPIKIETSETGHTTMAFSNVKFGKPDAAAFEAPTGYKKYDSQQNLMMEEMKKRMGTPSLPAGHP